MEPLAGKVALVTGAARGQGKAHALTLAAAGADIVVFDVPDFVESGSYPLATAEDLAATVQAVRETGRDGTGRDIVAIEGDVRSSKSLSAAAAAGIDHFGRIDICIANAGSGTPRPSGS
jgi:NAD(P)-dependent dehydrogenase (short-subunit alcohol dehydrogenase family)